MQAQFTFQWNSKGIQADNVQGFVLYFLEKGHKFAVMSEGNIKIFVYIFMESLPIYQCNFHIIIKSVLTFEFLRIKTKAEEYFSLR